MKIPPLWIRLKFREDGGGFGLWFPMFLLWPVALAILIILAPLILLAVLILWPTGWGKWILQILGNVYTIVCALRGLKVDIKNERQIVYITVA
jgi:hypothetical protein